jgi:hypothetical protein
MVGKSLKGSGQLGKQIKPDFAPAIQTLGWQEPFSAYIFTG